MAAGVLPEPGSPFGPCVGSCQHIDCRQTRADALARCVICRQPIGYGRLFYRDGIELVHASCAEAAAEKVK